MALKRVHLDAAQCATPGCDHSQHSALMFLHGRCHPSAPTWAAYNRETGNLEITCAECEATIATIEVAE